MAATLKKGEKHIQPRESAEVSAEVRLDSDKGDRPRSSLSVNEHRIDYQIKDEVNRVCRWFYRKYDNYTVTFDDKSVEFSDVMQTTVNDFVVYWKKVGIIYAPSKLFWKMLKQRIGWHLPKAKKPPPPDTDPHSQLQSTSAEPDRHFLSVDDEESAILNKETSLHRAPTQFEKIEITECRAAVRTFMDSLSVFEKETIRPFVGKGYLADPVRYFQMVKILVRCLPHFNEEELLYLRAIATGMADKFRDRGRGIETLEVGLFAEFKKIDPDIRWTNVRKIKQRILEKLGCWKTFYASMDFLKVDEEAFLKILNEAMKSDENFAAFTKRIKYIVYHQRQRGGSGNEAKYERDITGAKDLARSVKWQKFLRNKLAKVDK